MAPEAGGPPRRPGRTSGGAEGRGGRAIAGPAGADPSGRARRTAPRSRARVDNVRLTAYDVLRAVDERDAYANLVLPGMLRDRGLTGRDAALATEITYGVLRGRGRYDAVLGACVDRPLADVDAPIVDALRIGAHQLLAMRVPPHAAVGTTVDLARHVGGDGPSRFVNAVLRRVATHDLAAWVGRVAPAFDTDPLGHLAVAHSHPRWIVSALRDALGGDLEETAAALAANNAPPAVMLAARPGRGTVAELVEAGASAARFSPYGAEMASGDPGALVAVKSRRAGVQDEGSQLVALALVAAEIDMDVGDADVSAESGAGTSAERLWLDLAAGPGGKAALLQGLAADRGARLLAAERAPHRAVMVERALRGGPGRWLVVTADSTRPAWAAGSADRVLLDAPCTGLGALRRRPEARWRRQPSDLPGLTRLQRDLLSAALDATRTGGVVAYATCSPHLAETRHVVDAVLRGRDDVEQLDARPYLPGVPDLGPGPHVQLWPHRHGTDAMHLSLLRRR